MRQPVNIMNMKWCIERKDKGEEGESRRKEERIFLFTTYVKLWSKILRARVGSLGVNFRVNILKTLCLHCLPSCVEVILHRIASEKWQLMRKKAAIVIDEMTVDYCRLRATRVDRSTYCQPFDLARHETACKYDDYEMMSREKRSRERRRKKKEKGENLFIHHVGGILN